MGVFLIFEREFAMSRVYNFSAGPSVLPESVLKTAAAEMLEYGSSGQSVMEMSHRSKEYQAIFDQTEADLREVLEIPDDFSVLFLQGGASSQFAMVPLNLASESGKADYVTTGAWSKKALSEAKRYINTREVASSADKTFSYIPTLTADMFDPEADYVHITLNNTIYGTHFAALPDTNGVSIVADASSCILSEKIDWSRFACVYAGAQKNMAPAGVTVVIVRKALLGKAMEVTPTMFNYEIHDKDGSMFNTPPCYTIYMLGLVLKWVKENGGIDGIAALDQEKADLLYNYLDSSKMFSATVAGADRSIMNIPFVTGDDEKDAAFIKFAKENGLVNLKGHRSVGGMRASIYNAMPTEGVEKLVEIMRAFEAK
jgi:phosphoserine aminotransferase